MTESPQDDVILAEGPAAIEALKDTGPTKPPRSRGKDVWDQFRKHKGAMFGGGFLLFITLAVLLGPYIWQVDAQKLDIRNKDLRPIWTALWDAGAKTAWSRPFGTDQLGRDQLAQIIQGGRTSMAVGWAAMILSLIIGTTVGVLAGFVRKADGLLMRLTDGVIARVGNVLVFVPQIALLFLLVGLLEDSGYLSRAAFLLDRLMARLGLQL